MAQESEAVSEAARTLYAAAPDEFMATRSELAKQARAAGDAAAATQIEKLRKPTVAAWIVNALVHDDPTAVERLTALGEQLRTAQERLDATAMRQLTTKRRKLVDDLTRQALRRAKKGQPAAGLRDEVSGTFEAAGARPALRARRGGAPRGRALVGLRLRAERRPAADRRPRRAGRAGRAEAGAEAERGRAASAAEGGRRRPARPGFGRGGVRGGEGERAGSRRAGEAAEPAAGEAPGR